MWPSRAQSPAEEILLAGLIDGLGRGEEHLGSGIGYGCPLAWFRRDEQAFAHLTHGLATHANHRQCPCPTLGYMKNMSPCDTDGSATNTWSFAARLHTRSEERVLTMVQPLGAYSLIRI